MYGYLSAIQELPVTRYMQVAEEHLFRLNHALLFFCKDNSFEMWNAKHMYGALDVNLIWEKAHSHKAVAPVICSLIQICFKIHQNSFYNFIFKTYEVHRCIPQSSFYCWPPWVFLSEPLLPSPFTCPSPPPVPTHVHLCPICKKGMLARVFPRWCDHALQLLTSIQEIAIPIIPQICLYKPLDLQCDRHLKWRGAPHAGSGYLNFS